MSEYNFQGHKYLFVHNGVKQKGDVLDPKNVCMEIIWHDVKPQETYTDHFLINYLHKHTVKMILRNVVTRYTQFNLKILLYGDSGIDHNRNAVIVQAVHDYIRDSESDFNFASYTIYYLQMV